MAFSPSFAYALASSNVDANCKTILSMSEILEVLSQRGTVPIKECPAGCEIRLATALAPKAKTFKLGSYSLIGDVSSANRVTPTKTSLAHGKPVVAVLNIGLSFEEAKDHWKPESFEYEKKFGPADSAQGLLVVGYDDTKFGGAVEVMNSWSTDWGVDGYTWIKYRDFDRFSDAVYQISLDTVASSGILEVSGPPDSVSRAIASEITGSTDTLEKAGSMTFAEAPHPEKTLIPSEVKSSSETPAPFLTDNSYCSVRFLDINRTVMRIRKDDDLVRLVNSYQSRTCFQVDLSVNASAYVYAVVCDSESRRATVAYPVRDQSAASSPFTPIRLPSRSPRQFHALDDHPGLDYYCVLVSRASLDIASVVNEINNVEGSFPERLRAVLNVSTLAFPSSKEKLFISPSLRSQAVWSRSFLLFNTYRSRM